MIKIIISISITISIR